MIPSSGHFPFSEEPQAFTKVHQQLPAPPPVRSVTDHTSSTVPRNDGGPPSDYRAGGDVG
jgi:hypothetical protein